MASIRESMEHPSADTSVDATAASGADKEGKSWRAAALVGGGRLHSQSMSSLVGFANVQFICSNK